MSAAEILALTRYDGLTVTATAGGELNVCGPREIVAWWAPTLRTAKADIVAWLNPSATVVIEAHGYLFAIETGPGAPHASGCVALSADEIEWLGVATDGAPLPASMVHTIAKAKSAFPGATLGASRVMKVMEGGHAVQES